MIFKKRSQQLFDRMLLLVALARFMVFHAVLETYGSTRDKHARRIVRYLFNDPEQESDKADIFREATKIEAMNWLDANPGWRELVLQTLKVEMVARSDKVQNDPDDLNNLISSPVLRTYGGDYPSMVDPQSYTELVAQTLARSSNAVKEAVRQQSAAGASILSS